MEHFIFIAAAKVGGIKKWKLHGILMKNISSTSGDLIPQVELNKINLSIKKYLTAEPNQFCTFGIPGTGP